MSQIIFATRRIGMAAAVAAALLSPLAASAQSDLDSSEAEAFMGAWVVAIESDFGPFSMDLEVEDQDGKVAASIGSPDMGGPMQDVSNIMRTGEGLTLTWEMDAQGQMVEAIMILAPDGDDMSAMFSVADGQFMASGVATKAEN